MKKKKLYPYLKNKKKYITDLFIYKNNTVSIQVQYSSNKNLEKGNK